MLSIMFSMILTSCSAFDSDPIEPNIIGSGNLHYEAKSGTWFVVVASTRYTVANVSIPDPEPYVMRKIRSIEPVDGMLVTVFTSPHMKGIQGIVGKQSIKQIEELYRSTASEMRIVFIFFICIAFGLVCIMAIATPRTEEVPVVNADV